MPNGTSRIMRYNKETPIADRMKLVETHIISYWEEFFRDNWLKESTNIKGSNIHAKSILDRCATFILLADMRKNDILSKAKIDSINKHEVTILSDDEQELNLESKLVIDEVQPTTATEISQEEKKVARQVKKWNKSKTRKFYKMYSTPKVFTYRVKPVRDEDGKVAKNIVGQAVYNAEYVTIGGNKGLIDKSKPYISKWCLVDTDNKFTFNDIGFIIDKSVEQYKVGKDNVSEMDTILAYYIPDKNEYYFFDENIDEIQSIQQAI